MNIKNFIYNKYVMMNQNQFTPKDAVNKCYVRYNNKNVIFCAIALNTITPIFMDFNVQKNDQILTEITKKCVYNNYSSLHDDIAKYYQYCSDPSLRVSLRNSRNSICFIINQLENKKYPDYICRTFEHLQYEIQKNPSRKDNILEILKNKEMLKSELDSELTIAIEKFFNNNDQGDNDDDY